MQPSRATLSAARTCLFLLVFLSVRAPQKEAGFYLISNQYEPAAATTPPLGQIFPSASPLCAARHPQCWRKTRAPIYTLGPAQLYFSLAL